MLDELNTLDIGFYDFLEEQNTACIDFEAVNNTDGTDE